MYPSVFIFGKNIFLYGIINILGTVLGLGAMFAVLYKFGTKDKKGFAAYFISLVISFPFTRVLRGIIEAENIGELMICGSHFMGLIFAFYFIFPVVYKLICKKVPSEEIKGFSTVYFSIQHLCNRLGCFSLGCCFGVYYNGPFSITFPYGTNPYMVYGEEIPIFPTQLFEALCAFCLLIMSLVMIHRHKKPYRPFIILFCISIFISEFFMHKYAFERTIFIFSYVQLCCVILLFIEGARFIRGKIKRK